MVGDTAAATIIGKTNTTAAAATVTLDNSNTRSNDGTTTGSSSSNNNNNTRAKKRHYTDDKIRSTTTVESQQQQQQQQPITIDGERPQKRFYRQRAHCNPLAHNDSYDYPIVPKDMDWTTIFHHHHPNVVPQHDELLEPPNVPVVTTTSTTFVASTPPTVLDIGCGFGGLTLALASILPTQNICGIEIRAKVTEYVRLRIIAARKDLSYCINPHAISTSIPPYPLSSASTSLSTSSSVANTRDESSSRNAISLPAIPLSSLHRHVPLKTTTAATTTTDKTTSNVPVVVEEHNSTLTSSLSLPEQQPRHHYNNCGIIRTNSMKYIPNYFLSHTMEKLFFCFPDPHFKRKNFCRRIISYRLLDEYAYILIQQSRKKSSNVVALQPLMNDERESSSSSNINSSRESGKLYAITDVKELHEWHVNACNTHPLFRPLLIGQSSSSSSGVPSVESNTSYTQDDTGSATTITTVDDDTHNNNNKNESDTTMIMNNNNNDPCIYAMKYLTEEGQKVDRNHGTKYYIIYQCILQSPPPQQQSDDNVENDDHTNKNHFRNEIPNVHAGNFFLQ